ncbi:MAG: hypothetical protein QOC81_1298 [Thermoanaerobaculia bacterium]|jgi:hypothetical protein|nr:hypothetical protein [Thermoanaerobaculia bacterium]
MGESADVTGGGSRAFLIVVALTMAGAAFAFVVNPPEIGSAKSGADARGLAERIARHPTDWPAASALTEVALDTRLDTRVLLWRSAFEHASLLAPERRDPPNAFARAAFFHWQELSEADHRNALAAYGRLLGDPAVFARTGRPIFELTGDLFFLQRVGPQTADTLAWLTGLASSSGKFADYRKLRGELPQKRIDEFGARLHTVTSEELLARFPDPPYHASDEPLIKALLDELHQRPLSEGAGRKEVVDAIVDYALRHDLGPLDGLEVISRTPGAAGTETRIKLSLALGLKERAAQLQLGSSDPRHVPPNDHDWQGLCGADVCNRAWRMIEADHGIALTLQTAQTDELPAYVEIYVDDVLRAEGEVGVKRDFIVPAGNRGTHRIEVMLANPVTRNLASRRVHVASITTL